MARKTMPENFIGVIDRLLELPPAKVSSARSYVDEVNLASKELLETLDAGLRKELTKLVARFEAGAAKLLQSLANLSLTDTRLDWVRLSEHDLLRLKDDAFALREFLVTHAGEIRHAYERFARDEIRLEDVIKRLRSERAVSGRTWALLARCVQAKGRSKELKDPAVVERLAKLSYLLSRLREAREIVQTG